jgi:hypothetical protein
VVVKLERQDIVRFARRDWPRVRAAKEQHWAELARRRGPRQGLQVSEALWAHAKSVDPSWPSERERQTDLEHHLRFASRLRRLAHVFGDS